MCAGVAGSPTANASPTEGRRQLQARCRGSSVGHGPRRRAQGMFQQLPSGDCSAWVQERGGAGVHTCGLLAFPEAAGSLKA